MKPEFYNLPSSYTLYLSMLHILSVSRCFVRNIDFYLMFSHPKSQNHYNFCIFKLVDQMSKHFPSLFLCHLIQDNLKDF